MGVPDNSSVFKHTTEPVSEKQTAEMLPHNTTNKTGNYKPAVGQEPVMIHFYLWPI